MLTWAIFFFVLMLIAGLFGFGLIAGAAYLLAKILFFVFMLMFLVSLIFRTDVRLTHEAD